jgi:DnaJ-class molecular chaperone
MLTECPCCHGAGELEVRDHLERVMFCFCVHCSGSGKIKIEEPKKREDHELLH